MGEKDVLDYLDDVAGIRGFDVVSRASIVTPPKMPEQQARANDRKLETASREFFRALAEGRERRPGLRSVVIFHGRRPTFDELADDFPADHACWKEQGRLDPSARYYTSAPINPLYDTVGRIVEWVAGRRNRRDLAAMRRPAGHPVDEQRFHSKICGRTVPRENIRRRRPPLLPAGDGPWRASQDLPAAVRVHKRSRFLLYKFENKSP